MKTERRFGFGGRRLRPLLVTLVVGAGAVAQEELGLPVVPSTSFPLDTAAGGVEVPRDARLAMPGNEGTLEFWFTPEWASSGAPDYFCVIVNGRTVRRPRSPESDELQTFFDTRYAVYLSRTSILFQTGSQLIEKPCSEFGIESTFKIGRRYHVLVTTGESRTKIVIDGRYSQQIDSTYGKGAGSGTYVGCPPPGAEGVVETPVDSYYDSIDERWVDTLHIEDRSRFGPMRGLLGGVRIWSRRMPDEALSAPEDSGETKKMPLTILGYTQAHAERDLSPRFVGVRLQQVRRADLIAFSDFGANPSGAACMRIADPIGGIWLDQRMQKPGPAAVSWMADFEPVVLANDCPLIVFVPERAGADLVGRYGVYRDGEWAGDLLPSETASHAYELRDLDGKSWDVQIDAEDADKLEIAGLPEVFAMAGGDADPSGPKSGSIFLVRDKPSSKGAYTDWEMDFTVSQQKRNWPFMLRSFDLLTLDPNSYWENTNQDRQGKFVFAKPGRFDNQLKDKVKLPWAMYLHDFPLGGAKETSVTATTERERMTAVRARFGLSGGYPGVITGGVSAEGSWQEETLAAGTAVTTESSSFKKLHTIINDMVSARLSAEFRDDAQRLAVGVLSPGAFIEAWGTHYVRALTEGAVAKKRRKFSEEKIQEALSASIDISAFTEVGNATSSQETTSGKTGGVKAEGGGGTSVYDRLLELHAIEETEWDYKGGDGGPEGGTVTIDNAVPICFDMRSLHELLSPAYFEDPAVYIGARARLRDAIITHLKGGPIDDTSPYRDETMGQRLIFHIKISRFVCRSYDGTDGVSTSNDCEFFGRITGMAFVADGRGGRTPWLWNGKAPQHPTEIWNCTDVSRKDWEEHARDEDFGADKITFNTSADDSQKAGPQGVEFDKDGAGRPKDTECAGSRGEDGYGLKYLVDHEDVPGLEVELKFLLAEEDDTNDDRYVPVERRLRVADFRGEGYDADQWATAEKERHHWIEMKEDDGDGTVRFRVDTWVEFPKEARWHNKDRECFGLLTESMQAGLRKTRSRTSLDAADSGVFDAGDLVAFFPRDFDGLRRPGARHFEPDNDLPGMDMSGFSLQFDLQPADDHLQVNIGPSGGEDYDSEPTLQFNYWADDSDPNYVGLKTSAAAEGPWNARFYFRVPPAAVMRAYEVWRARSPDAPAPYALEYWKSNGVFDAVNLNLEAAAGEWLTVGIAYSAEESRLSWLVFERATKKVVAQGSHDYRSLSRPMKNQADLILRYVQPATPPRKLTAQRYRFEVENGNVTGEAPVVYQRRGLETGEMLDEIYVLRCALNEAQMRLLALESREPAKVSVAPVAYWSFDDKRPNEPMQRSYPEGVSRTRDDALMLVPAPDRLGVARGLDVRDLTVQADLRFTDSTRSVTLTDESGLFGIEALRSAERNWLGVRIDAAAAWRKVLAVAAAEEDAKLKTFSISEAERASAESWAAMAASFCIFDDLGPQPYVWQRVSFTFDGLRIYMVADDGSGWVRTKGFSISDRERDAIAALARLPAFEGLMTWQAAATYNRHGTLEPATAGYRPGNEDELAQIDEVRVWRGAQADAALPRQLTVPRQYSPPGREQTLLAYQPFEAPSTAGPTSDADLLDALISTASRSDHSSDPVELEDPASLAVDEHALKLGAGARVVVRTTEPVTSDFTLHLDFRPGTGRLQVRNGPFEFRCEDGRPVVLLDCGADLAPVVFDPAFGDRLAPESWHKLVIAVDGWRSKLNVILDGEALGEIALTRAVVDALRAGDKEGASWLLDLDEEAADPAWVDELLVLRPALEQEDLVRLSERVRVGGGASPPTSLDLADGLGKFDRDASNLRAADAALEDKVVAYFPLDGTFEERSGRHAGALAAGVAYPLESAWTATARGASSPGGEGDVLVADLPGLDRNAYTVAVWFRIDGLPGTLLHLPGLTVEVTQAGRLFRERLGTAVMKGWVTQEQFELAVSSNEGFMAFYQQLLKETASLERFQDLMMLFGISRLTRNAYSIDVLFDSVDGRSAASPLSFAGFPEPLYVLPHSEDEIDQRTAENLRMIASVLAEGEWHLLALGLDVRAGVLRGSLNGRRLGTMPLPKGFALRGSQGAIPRRLTLGPWCGGVDEVLVLNGAELQSSATWELVERRPQVDGDGASWQCEGGFFHLDVPVRLRAFDRWTRDSPVLLTAVFDAVPGVGNRYVIRHPSGKIRERVDGQPGLDGKPGKGHDVVRVADPTLVPRFDGDKVVTDWADAKIPWQWEVQPVRGGGFVIRCTTEGRFRGWSLAFESVPVLRQESFAWTANK